jgi:hypothetical protein
LEGKKEFFQYSFPVSEKSLPLKWNRAPEKFRGNSTLKENKNSKGSYKYSKMEVRENEIGNQLFIRIDASSQVFFPDKKRLRGNEKIWV